MSEEVLWQPLLRDSLVALALPAEEQVRVNGPGCITCDLLNDFDHARSVAVGNAPDLSLDQCASLDRIDAAMRSMSEADYECFNNEVIGRPVWQQLRAMAADALHLFGWAGASVEPFVEVQDGVWHRPLSGIEPNDTKRGDLDANP